ncbi:ABC transporter transmembrane domain-containing protein [Acidithiobacillus ferrooxidans]|uniref:ABC transporter ATP-binding protein n=1 Tax=Acidithiobacillus ferrooxidans TaxID=920 RepID=UPI00214CE29D|nr:ABC transporter transmembrane domain-containing protein [Acidithiobacillus ferrooxidans]
MAQNPWQRPVNKNVWVLWKLKPFLLTRRMYLLFYALALLLSVASALVLPQGARWILDQGFHSFSALVWISAALLGVGLFTVAMRALRDALATWIGQGVVADLRTAVFRHALHLPAVFYEVFRSGEVISRLSSDVTILRFGLTGVLGRSLQSGITLIGALALMAATLPQLIIPGLAALPLLVLINLKSGRLQRRYSRKEQDCLADLSAHTEESINGIRVIQALTLEPQTEERYRRDIRLLLEQVRSRVVVQSWSTFLTGGLVFLALSVMLYWGGLAVLRHQVGIGVLVAFLLYALMAATSLASLGELWGSMARLAGATERLLALLDETPEVGAISSTQDSEPTYVNGGLSAQRAIRAAGLHLNNVSFSYPSRSDSHAIENISIDIAAGETVAFVGASGAGKSTIFSLLLRHYQPDQGSIFLDGVDINILPLRSLRQQLAVVPQHPVIFSMSIAENIMMARPGASEPELHEAVHAARVDEFSDRLERRLQTHVGEKGVTLSGGQRQRIAIARAILRNPRVLILDEATSALDAENERIIQEALGNLIAQRTTLVAAHRLATIIHASRIAVLDKGRLIAVGSHQELLKSCPVYRQFAQLQRLHDEGHGEGAEVLKIRA